MPIAAYGIGDWVGDFSLPTAAGQQFKLSQVVGLPVVMLFFGDDPTQVSAAEAACTSLAKVSPQFVSLNAPILAVRKAVDSLDAPAPSALVALPYPVLLDPNGGLSARYGASELRAALI